MEDWKDSKKFWSETWRTIFFAIGGLTAAYFIFDPIKDKSAYQATIDKEKLILKERIIDDFLSKSYKYTAIAYDALNGALTEVQRYQGTERDEFNDVRNRMTVYFSSKKLNQMVDESKIIDSSLYSSFTKKDDKKIWEPKRKKLIQENNEIAKEALIIIKFIKE